MGTAYYEDFFPFYVENQRGLFIKPSTWNLFQQYMALTVHDSLFHGESMVVQLKECL